MKQKKQHTELNVSIRNEIIRIRVKINKIESKKYERSIKPRSGSLKSQTKLVNL